MSIKDNFKEFCKPNLNKYRKDGESTLKVFMTRMGSQRMKMSGWKKKSTYMKTKRDQACMIDSKIQTAIR